MNEHPRSVNRLAAPIKHLVQRFAYLGLVGAAFALMLLGKADTVIMERFRVQVTDAVAPILSVISQPVATVSEAVDRIRELANLREENAALRQDRERLMRWQSVAQRLEAENKALRDLLHFVPGPQSAFVTARVIGDTGGAFAHSLLLNADPGAGVRKGQAVVAGEGLVGRVAGVGSRSIRVLLITDLNSRIPVLVERTRARAILAGDNSDQPHLIHMPPGAQVSPGDRIVTSGHGGAFPLGLPVGVVASISDGGAVVQPYVERQRLEYVRVVDFGLRGILPAPPAAAGSKGRRTRAETP